jgi:hypothetical protein
LIKNLSFKFNFKTETKTKVDDELFGGNSAKAEMRKKSKIFISHFQERTFGLMMSRDSGSCLGVFCIFQLLKAFFKLSSIDH